MEIILRNEQEPILDNIVDFLQELNAEEQKEINDFLQGVKFYKNNRAKLQPTG